MRKIFAIFCVSIFCSAIVYSASLSLADKLALAKRLADEAADGKAESGRVVNNNFNFNEELSKYRAQTTESAQLESDADLSAAVEPQKTIRETPQKEVKTELAAPSVADKKPLDEPKIPIVLPDAGKRKVVQKPKYKVDTKDFVNGFYVGDSVESKKMAKSVIDKLQEMKKFTSHNGDMFFIDGDSASAVFAVAGITKPCEELVADTFGKSAAKLSDSRKIILQIYASKDSAFKLPHQLIIRPNGEIVLSARWNKNLELEDFCRLLSSAALRKMMPANASKIPYWLESAFEVALEQRISLGLIVDLARVASENPPPDLATLLNYSESTAISKEIRRAHLFWLFKSFERAARTDEAFNDFIKSSIELDKPDDMLKLVEKKLKPKGLDLNIWWRTLITGEIWSRLGGVNTPSWSAAEVVRLSVIQQSSESGERVSFIDRGVWDNRQILNGEISARILEIKTALAKVNPLYFNALVSLGRMFEICTDDGSESDFEESRRVFIKEFADAKKLSDEAKNLMSK